MSLEFYFHASLTTLFAKNGHPPVEEQVLLCSRDLIHKTHTHQHPRTRTPLVPLPSFPHTLHACFTLVDRHTLKAPKARIPSNMQTNHTTTETCKIR